jgi:hypothetical protein
LNPGRGDREMDSVRETASRGRENQGNEPRISETTVNGPVNDEIEGGEDQNQGRDSNEAEVVEGNQVDIGPSRNEARNYTEFRGIDTRRNRRANRAQSNNQNETTARPNVPNPYLQAAERTRSNPPRISQCLPIAEMRSNDAPQDDQMPVGNVVGLASNQERRTEDPGNAARDETIRISQNILNAARRDSAERFRVSQIL